MKSLQPFPTISAAILVGGLMLAAIFTAPGFVAAQPRGGDDAVGDEGPGPNNEEAGPGRRDRMRDKFRQIRDHFADERGDEAHENAGGGRDHVKRMKRMKGYLEFVQEFVKSVEDPYQAVGLAAIGVRDSFRKSGKPADAVPVLQEMMKDSKDQKIRNIFLFLIRQSYQDAKDDEKFLEISKQIIRENTGK